MYRCNISIVKKNYSVLKVYGCGDSKKIKVVTLGALNVSPNTGVKNYSKKGTVNDEKLSENISRAKNRIFEYAYCNPWDWFFTGTLDPKKFDRSDLEAYHKKFVIWLRDYNKKYGLKIKFLLIPELHRDGKSWHMHGFLYGLPVDHLEQFKLGNLMGKGVANKVMRGDVVYNWVAYAEKFGFCNLEYIGNYEAVSKYITKYINKSLASSVTELNAHMYYVSRGLNRAQTVKQGTMFANIEYDYENEHCKIAWLDYSEELLEKLENSFI
jgi:hypothetical protein